MRTNTIRATLGLLGAVLLTSLCVGGAAQADTQSCREWRGEHREWKTEVLRRYLKAAPQREVDDAVFELLQREAWLTSCDISVRVGREELVGWRLAQRLPDEFGNAVVESVLARAGFDVSLRQMFAQPEPRVASEAPPVRRTARSSRRARSR